MQNSTFNTQQATLTGGCAILMWSVTVGLFRSVAEIFGAVAGAALIFSIAALFANLFIGAPRVKIFPSLYLWVGGGLFVLYEALLALSITALQRARLLELPKGWIELSVENLFDIEDGDRGEHYPTKSDFSEAGHCLFLNAKNVTKRGFAFQDVSFISEKKDLELRKGKLKRGDIVFTSRGTLGNIAHYSDSIEYKHLRINSGMFIIRNYDISLTPDFLYYHLNAPLIASQIERLQSGTAQPQLPIRDFKSFRFVIPSKKEQQQIVKELESKLSEIDQLEQTITNSLQQADSLRQSILKKAFFGELVPQDPNDEPASILLARIKAEKEVQASKQAKSAKVSA